MATAPIPNGCRVIEIAGQKVIQRIDDGARFNLDGTPRNDQAIKCSLKEAASGLRNCPRCAELQAKNDAVGKRVAGELTAKELRILSLLVDGLPNADIADRMGTSEQVIKNHFRIIYQKTGVESRVTMALFVARHPALASALVSELHEVAS